MSRRARIAFHRKGTDQVFSSMHNLCKNRLPLKKVPIKYLTQMYNLCKNRLPWKKMPIKYLRYFSCIQYNLRKNLSVQGEYASILRVAGYSAEFDPIGKSFFLAIVIHFDRIKTGEGVHLLRPHPGTRR